MKYFTSDLHIDHERSINFPRRKGLFTTIKEWQSYIINAVNTKVQKNDFLYILGDFGLDPEKWRFKIKCANVVLIKGNHDPSDAKCRRAFGKTNVFDTRCIKVHDIPTFLSHYPHLAWPASHYGSYHLYGHVHDSRSIYWREIAELSEIRSLDVSPESYKRLFGQFNVFSETEIHDILSNYKGHDDVSWYRAQEGEF